VCVCTHVVHSTEMAVGQNKFKKMGQQ